MRKNSWIFYGGIALALALGAGVAAVKYIGARGIRNNNPGNIRRDGTAWLGAVSILNGATDAAFVQFASPEYGIRAMARILASYAKRGVVTLTDIAKTWAPPNENDTAAYIAALAKVTGWLPTRRVTPQDYPALIAAIIRQENGTQPYPTALIQRGVDLA